MKNYSVIATPSHQYNDPNFGEVKILFYYDQDSENPIPLIPTADIFKSKFVWITSGYDSAIQGKYAPGELFLLTDIQPTRHNPEDHNSTRDYHDWCGRGSNVNRLTNQFIPVLKTELPNIDSGLMVSPPGDIRRGLHFIENNGSVYGPFEITISEGVAIAAPSRPLAVSGTNDHITKTNLEDIIEAGLICESSETINGARKFITSLKNFGITARSMWTEVDYISAKRIFKQLHKMRSKSKASMITKKELSRLDQDIEKIFKDRHAHINDQDRLKRASGLLKDLQGNDEWFEVIESFLNSDDGKKSLTDHFKGIGKSTGSTEDADGLKSQLAQIRSDISTAETKLQDTKQQLADSEASIKAEASKNRQSLELLNDELRKEHQQLLDGLDKIKQDGLSLKEQYKQFQTLSDLEGAINKLNDEYRDLEGAKRTMETAVKRQQDLLATPESLAAELTSVHTVMQSLGYAQFSSTASGVELEHQYSPEKSATFEDEVTTSDLIIGITEKMNAPGGKTLSSVEVANLLICTQQHIIVILKGRPGVGKTSTAIKMAEAIGIKTDESQDADFLNVPVARGWSSSRDLLGYYNSLRGEYQQSKTGVYQFLRDGELDEATNVRMILLDEANLSPIEHYWSDFIGLCDAEGANRTIKTGSHKEDERNIHPNKNNNLRFVATINSDATVEPLSDRLLDRAPVICMDTSDEHEISGDALPFKGALSNELLEQLFGRQDLSDVDLSNSVDQIVEFLQCGIDIAPQLGNCLYIDGRRRINIEQYLQTATTVFEDDTIARDFAVAQFVLPHLRCDGAGMEDAINALIKYCKERNWERSEDILQGILKRGDKYLQHYSFL